MKRNFPLPGHANALPAARAAEAAGRQGMYEEYSDMLFTNQAVWVGLANPTATFESYAATLGLNITQFRADVADPAIQTRIDADLATANALSLPGTPTLFLNGREISTPTTSEAFVALIDTEAATQTNIPATVSVISIDATSARIRVTPNTGFAGSFRVRVGARDAFHGTDAEAFDLAEVNVTVAANRIPQATAQNVMLTDTNPKLITLGGNDGDATIDQSLTFILTSLPTQGTLTDQNGVRLAKDINLNSTQVRYVPNANFSGTESFAFKVRDDGGTAGGGQDTSASATVSMQTAPNNAPTATPQHLLAPTGMATHIVLIGDDGDANLAQTLTFQIADQPQHGTLSNFNAATGTVDYTPTGNNFASDSFTFRVMDGGGTANGGHDTSSPATVSIQIPFNVQTQNATAGQSSPQAAALPNTAGQSGVAGTLTNNTAASAASSFTVGQYSGNPTATTLNDSMGFVEVRATGTDTTDSSRARFYYPSTVNAGAETNLRMFFFDGTQWRLVKSSGGTDPAKDTTDNLDGTTSGGRFSATFDNTSTPRITELTGTAFAFVGRQTTTPGTGPGDIKLKRGVLSIRGTRGDDVIECELSADGTSIEVAVNDAAIESFSLDEIRVIKIRAGAGDDLITISPDVELPARIRCGRGNDEATSGSGDDRIRGGRGNDMLDGADGNDHLRGQQGDDDLVGDAGNDRLRGGRGNDSADGGAGDDRIHGGRGIDELLGGAGADLIRGYLGDDVLSGGDGPDTLHGGQGNDTDEDDDPLDRLFGIP